MSVRRNRCAMRTYSAHIIWATISTNHIEAEATMPDIKIFNPDALGKPLGQYSQITRVKASEFVFIAGQVGADRDGKGGEDFDAQCAVVYANIESALKSVGGGWSNEVEFTPEWVN